MKLNIRINKPDKDNNLLISNEIVEIKLPITAWRPTGFSIGPDGKGTYLGPAMNFGGPKGGDLICFDKTKTKRPFYAIMTGMTQDFDTRSGSIKFVCFSDELVARIVEGVKEKAKTEMLDYSIIMNYVKPLIGFGRALDLIFEISSNRLNDHLDNLINALQNENTKAIAETQTLI